MQPTLKLFSPLAATAEKNLVEPGAKTFNKRENDSMMITEFEVEYVNSFLLQNDLARVTGERAA